MLMGFQTDPLKFHIIVVSTSLNQILLSEWILLGFLKLRKEFV